MRGLGPIELIGRLRQSPIELKTLMAFGIAISGLLVFGAIAEDVMEGEKHGLDTWLLLALRNRSDPADPIGPTWLANAMSDMTALGGFAVLTLLMTLSSLYLLLERKYRSAVFLVFSVASGTGLVSALKAGFDRPRPDLVEHLTHATSPSFPSGHAAGSALAYLTIGLLLADAQGHRRARLFIVSSALLLTVLIGCSRVFLGVHWPSDVIAGWGFGTAWAILCWLVARFLNQTKSWI